MRVYEACERELRGRFGDDDVWSDAQEQLLHRLPLGGDGGGRRCAYSVGGRIVDAREASDLIAKLSGKAYWRKLFVRRNPALPSEAQEAMVREAQAICAEILAKR